MRQIILLIVSVLIININTAKGQGITRHFMTNLPVSLHTNPSLFPDYRYSIGFPLGNWFWETNTNMSLKQMISKIENNTLYISPNKIIDNLDKVNFVNNEFDLELLSTSFKVKKNYFSLFLSNKTFFEFRYPRDLLALGWQGNGPFIGGQADFSGIGVDAVNYNELALGYSRLIKDKLYIGGRFKYLQGIVNLKTVKSDITISIDTTTYWLTANYSTMIRIAAPIDTNGPSFNSPSDVLNFGNPGMAFDIGASYKINDKLSASLSIIDLGYIHWTKNTKSYFLENGKLAFQGLKIDSTFNFDFSDSALNLLTDTLMEKFSFQKSITPFSTSLNSKLYITANYNLTPKDRFGLVIYNRFDSYYNLMNYSLLYQRKFGNILSLCANYTLNSRGNSKLGTGLSLRILGSNFYFITDDIVSLINPINAHTISFNFGWNYIKSKPKKSAVSKTTF